jgi:hypothetical protein
MTAKNAKKKLCWNCEGRVSFDEENCTYCGVYLSPTPIGDEDQYEDDDVPAPPYRMDNSKGVHEVPAAPYHTHADESVSADALPSGGDVQQMKTVLMPLSLLLSGSVFFLFGLVLLLFSSNNGVFTLQWNANLWPLYFILGVGMLFFGWRTLRHLDDN